MKIKIFPSDNHETMGLCRQGVISRDKDDLLITIEYKDGRYIEINASDDNKCIEFHNGRTLKNLNTYKVRR